MPLEVFGIATMNTTPLLRIRKTGTPSCVFLFLVFCFSLCSFPNTIFAIEYTQEELVDLFISNEFISVSNEYLADAVALGADDGIPNTVFTELLISYLIIPADKHLQARMEVGGEDIFDPFLSLTLSADSPLEGVLEVHEIDDTENATLTVATITADTQPLRITEFPLRVSVSGADIGTVLRDVRLVIGDRTYSDYAISNDGTSALVIFDLGSLNSEPPLDLESGESVDAYVVATLYGKNGNYENRELLDASINETDRNLFVSRKLVPNLTPSILTELCIAYTYIPPEHIDDARAVALLYSEETPSLVLDELIDLGYVSSEYVESSYLLLFEDTTVNFGGTVLGNTHELISRGIFTEFSNSNEYTETYNEVDDLLGIFEFQFDVTAFQDTYYVSATNTDAIHFEAQDGFENYLRGVTANATVTISSTAERDGDSFRVGENETESFTVTIVLHPGVSGTYRVVLKGLYYGESATSPLSNGECPMVPQDDFVSNYVSLEGDPIPADITPPTITLLGENPTYVTVHTAYAEKGATAYDDVDGDLTALIDIVGTIDIGVPGVYEKTYIVSDSSLNSTTTVRTVIVRSLGGGGGSGGGSTDENEAPQNAQIVINSGRSTTTSRLVLLTLQATDSDTPLQMQISNTNSFSGVPWVPYKTSQLHTLSDGYGEKVVYVRYRDSLGAVSGTVADTIQYVERVGGLVLGSGRYSFLNDIEFGMQNTDVTELQKRLQDEGFFTYPEITGYFGEVTHEAVKAYQKHHELPVTGYVGPLTRAKLNTARSTVQEKVSREDAERFVYILRARGILGEEKVTLALQSF